MERRNKEEKTLVLVNRCNSIQLPKSLGSFYMSNKLVLRKLHVKRLKFSGIRREITCIISRIEEIACKKIEKFRSLERNYMQNQPY